MSKTYRINEIFYSIQGEGVRAGTANVFVRFSGCNLKCSADDPESGFDCDTEFVSGIDLTGEQLLRQIAAAGFNDQGANCYSLILTGGEPTLQIDTDLIVLLRDSGYYIAIETNGTKELPGAVDWICVSPKSAEHTIRIKYAHELKYVRHVGQGIPKPSIEAANYLISPAFEADGSVRPETLRHCIDLVKHNPDWRLSVQQHKLWRVR